MGTDIHYVFQKKTEDVEGKEQWETLNLDQDMHVKDADYSNITYGEYYISRYYLLFAVIAGVRNGFGFAGSYRHEPLVPIAEGRGLPEGITSDSFDDVSYGVYGYGYVTENKLKSERYDLGDHSFNWLLGSEILDWFSTDRHIEQVGIIDRTEYDEWYDNGCGQPESYSSGVFGGIVELYDESNSDDLSFKLVRMFKQYQNVTHVRVKWKESINESLSEFKDMIQKLVDQHGEIRMVMGFDS